MRKHLFILSAMSIWVSGCGLNPSHTSSAPGDSATASEAKSQTFDTLANLPTSVYLVSANSRKCADVINGSDDNGARIQQWDCNENPQQTWTLSPNPDGTYLITHFSADSSTSHNLDVTNGSQLNGAPIQQWGPSAYDNLPTPTQQHWRFVPVAGGYEIVNANSGKCLDVTGISLNNGARLQQYTCLGGANQIWYIALDYNNVPGWWQSPAVSVKSGKCLDLYGGSTQNGAVIQQWQCNGYAQQNWGIWPENDGTYAIATNDGSQCLDVTNGSLNNTARIQSWQCNGNLQQHWFVAYYAGSLEFISAKSGKCIDVTSMSTANGAPLQQYACTGGSNQLWKYAPTRPVTN